MYLLERSNIFLIYVHYINKENIQTLQMKIVIFIAEKSQFVGCNVWFFCISFDLCYFDAKLSIVESVYQFN